MALTPRLDSVEALYRKLERELVRAFHHANQTHKADHFYNFCITASSLRDYLLERLGKTTSSAKQPFYDRWATEPVLVAAADIANSAKHFQLRDQKTNAPKTPRTKHVGAGKTSGADVYINDAGDVQIVRRTGVPTIMVTLEDGRKFELYSFMEEVTKYWRTELTTAGINVRRQTWRQLHGRAT
jgi:hypothetical protein